MRFRHERRAGVAALVASRIVLLIVLLTTLLALLAGCAQRAHPASGRRGASPATSGPSPAGTAASSPSSPSGPGTAGQARVWARATAVMKTMSVPERAGQLLVATVPGTAPADGGAALVSKYHLGGVIYFPANIQTATQVAALSNGLQRAALGGHPGLPLLIGTDQEGGIVAQLAGVSTLFPDQMAAGATRDPSLIQAEERSTGNQLRALGINLDYAPVADVNVDPANPVIGIRSFGSRPALAASMTRAAIDGFHQAGTAATAKHFPGHGDTNVDSHTGLPVIHHSLRQWWRIDAPPFQAAVRTGVDAIMIAHIVVPALDSSGLPASLSPAIVTGYLRDRLGYTGVVTTDSLRMAGVRKGRTSAQAAVLAVRAGCDQLLMPASVPAAYHAVLAAVGDGRISMARLDTSVTRIIALKLARGLAAHAQVDVATAAQRQNTPADQAAAQRLADRSVTLVKNAGRVLPLRGQAVHLTGPAAPGLAPALGAALGSRGGRLVTSAASAGVIVVATRNATADPAQRNLVARLAATGRPVVVVATGVPYDLGILPQAAAGLATYSSAGVSMTAVARVLTGQISPAGRLPVDIPGPGGGILYRFGTGLGY